MTDSAKASPARAPIVVLIPVFNDWEAAASMLAVLGTKLREASREASVLLVDDASTLPRPAGWLQTPIPGLRTIEVLELKRNLSHQRAICIGLAYVAAHIPCEGLVIMDGDGEDDPADVPRLIAELRAGPGPAAVFARREQRSEGPVFAGFYFAYRIVYRLLTGEEIRVGNFSALPGSLLERIASLSELWNHYASGVRKARIPTREIATRRAKRLAGRSKMNLVSLVTHGLSAISVHAETIGVRLFLTSLVVVLVATAMLGVVVGLRLFTDLAIPGWASSIGGIIVLLVAQSAMFSAFFAFIVLNARNAPAFLPSRDYAYFVSRLQLIAA